MADGRVEVLACGEEALLQQFEAWLRVGPALANVKEVLCVAHADVSYDDFTIRK